MKISLRERVPAGGLMFFFWHVIVPRVGRFLADVSPVPGDAGLEYD